MTTIEAVVAAAERSTQTRPRLGSDALRLLIGALVLNMARDPEGRVSIRSIERRRGLDDLRAWADHPGRTGQELRGALVEVAITAAARGHHSLREAESAKWLQALGADLEVYS